MILNFVVCLAAGILLFVFTDIIKYQFLFITTIVLIISCLILGPLYIKKKVMEFYEYEFDENIIVRKNLKTGEVKAYNMNHIKKYFIPTAYETSHLSYIELTFIDGIVWKIYVPPFSISQTKIYEELEKYIKEVKL